MPSITHLTESNKIFYPVQRELQTPHICSQIRNAGMDLQTGKTGNAGYSLQDNEGTSQEPVLISMGGIVFAPP